MVMILPLEAETLPDAAGGPEGPPPYAAVEPRPSRTVRVGRTLHTGALTTNPDDEDDEDDGGPEWLRPPEP